MWNTPGIQISTAQIIQEHVRILEAAIEQAEENNPSRPEIFEALAYLENRTIRSAGFKRYRAGLEKGRIEDLIEGMKLIKKALGV